MIPGINSTMSSVSVIWASTKSVVDKACTEIARSWTEAAFFVDVTITSSISCELRLIPNKENVKGSNNKYLFIRNDIENPP